MTWQPSTHFTIKSVNQQLNIFWTTTTNTSLPLQNARYCINHYVNLPTMQKQEFFRHYYTIIRRPCDIQEIQKLMGRHNTLKSENIYKNCSCVTLKYTTTPITNSFMPSRELLHNENDTKLNKPLTKMFYSTNLLYAFNLTSLKDLQRISSYFCADCPISQKLPRTITNFQ
jgi:hypothetical protein